MWWLWDFVAISNACIMLLGKDDQRNLPTVEITMTQKLAYFPYIESDSTKTYLTALLFISPFASFYKGYVHLSKPKEPSLILSFEEHFKTLHEGWAEQNLEYNLSPEKKKWSGRLVKEKYDADFYILASIVCPCVHFTRCQTWTIPVGATRTI